MTCALRQLSRWSFLITLLCAWPALAQVVRDGTLGPGAAVQPTGPDYQIPETMGEQRGANLFHSFTRFDLGAAESATFTGPGSVERIIGRITGGGPSSIDGNLRSTIPGAALFLFNPSGLLFGPDATIEVDGALHVTTADYLRFADGRLFSATSTVPSLLSAAEPTAFGFLAAPVGPIAFDETALELAAESTVTIVGNDLRMVGGDDPVIRLEGGRLIMVSVASPGEVTLGTAPDLTAFTRLGTITLTGPAEEPDPPGEVDVPDDLPGGDSADAPDPLIDVSGDPGGQVVIRGAELIADAFSIAALTEGDVDGPAIGIDLDLRDAVTLAGDTLLSTTTEGAGHAGDLVVVAPTVRLAGDAELLSDTTGSGAGGRVAVTATTLSLADDAEIASDTETTGAGGAVQLDVATLEITGNAEISSDTNPGSTGAGGRVVVNASRAIHLAIETEPGEQAGIFTNTEGAGPAGAIDITAPLIDMDGGAITAETSGSGRGGDVHLAVTRLRLLHDAAVSAESIAGDAGAGDAGQVAIDSASEVRIESGGTILAASRASNGGNITIDGGLVFVRDGAITANVSDGVGGNVTLSAGTVALDDARVVAQAGAGQGGAIAVTANTFLSSSSLLSASAGPAGISGTVEINAPEVDLTGGVTRPATELLDAAALLQAVCAERRGGEGRGRFVVANRRGLPTSPEGLPLAEADGATTLDPSARRVVDLSQAARDRVAEGAFAEAAQRLDEAEVAVAGLADTVTKVPVLIHVARSHHRLASASPERWITGLRAAHALLVQAVDLAERHADLRGASYALGALAQLYAAEHRLSEALYLARRAQAAAEQANAPESLYRWHWLAGRLLWQQGRADDAVRAYRRAAALLEDTRQEAFTRGDTAAAFFRESVAPVYRDLVAALLDGTASVEDEQQRATLLLEARAVVEKQRAAELRDYFHDPCVADLERAVHTLDEVAHGAAIIYPVSLEDRTELLVTLPSGVRRYTVEVGGAALTAEAHRLRIALGQPGSRAHLDPARRLYDWLVRPFAAELDRQGVDTLVFVPDGALRAVPPAAFHDGDRYLIERYAVAVAPGIGLVDPHPLRRQGMTLLLGGISEAVQGFPALPKVSDELAAIHRLFGGDLLLDSGFSAARMEEELVTTRPSVVHLASHAEFTGDPATSFLLTHDGRITMDRLADLVGVARYGDRPLELLVLSACETAAGDDRAALGLAGVAIRAGARSALGSLWPIADEAAFAVVEAFYQALANPDRSKAVALQEAQRKLLTDERFRHPFYWSPFLLISNWL